MTKKKKALAVEFYIAEEKTLLDDPKYTKLDAVQEKLTLPPDPERRVRNRHLPKRPKSQDESRLASRANSVSSKLPLTDRILTRAARYPKS